MIGISRFASILLALIISSGLVSPAFADRVYDFNLNRWVEVAGEPVRQPRLRERGPVVFTPAPAVSAPVRQAPTRVVSNPIPRELVPYQSDLKPGTVVVETSERRLYLVLEGGQALRYGIGVGRDGFRWTGSHTVTRKAEWPGWTPPAAMRQRQPHLPAYMPGGPENPLGARALYIGDTLYRLHGTSEPWTIGQAVSSGCIRLTNDDIIDLYNRVKIGARVVVRA